VCATCDVYFSNVRTGVAHVHCMSCWIMCGVFMMHCACYHGVQSAKEKEAASMERDRSAQLASATASAAAETQAQVCQCV
jgi:hypothetical protein